MQNPRAVYEAELEDYYSAFLKDCPAYQQTYTIDDLRVKEFNRLDRQKQVYLDYTGGGLYALSQVNLHTRLLGKSVFGNPHSSNPASLRTTRLVQEARKKVLSYFKASPDEYLVIFTANASGALKMVGESYPFRLESAYLLTFDNHIYTHIASGSASGSEGPERTAGFMSAGRRTVCVPCPVELFRCSA